MVWQVQLQQNGGRLGNFLPQEVGKDENIHVFKKWPYKQWQKNSARATKYAEGVLGVEVTGGCDSSGKVLFLRDVSILCSYFRHPMLVAISHTLFTPPVVFVLLCRFWKDNIGTACCCHFFKISTSITASVMTIAVLYHWRYTKYQTLPNRRDSQQCRFDSL